MKIFMVFLGLLLVNVSIMSYKGDYGRYVYLNRALENIAYECMEIAASDPGEAQAFGDGLLEHTISKLKGVDIRDYNCEVVVLEDGAAVCVRMDVAKLFRFPFSPVTSVVAKKISLYSK